MSGAEILLEPGVFPRLLQGLWVTVWIAGVSVGLSVPVGLVVGWLMTMKNPVIRVLTRIYFGFHSHHAAIGVAVHRVLRFRPCVELEFGCDRRMRVRVRAVGRRGIGRLVRGALESIPKASMSPRMCLG